MIAARTRASISAFLIPRPFVHASFPRSHRHEHIKRWSAPLRIIGPPQTPQVSLTLSNPRVRFRAGWSPCLSVRLLIGDLRRKPTRAEVLGHLLQSRSRWLFARVLIGSRDDVRYRSSIVNIDSRFDPDVWVGGSLQISWRPILPVGGAEGSLIGAPAGVALKSVEPPERAFDESKDRLLDLLFASGDRTLAS